MPLFTLTLLAAALLCTLVAGFLFAFAVVIMPGLRTLEDGEFLHTFQVIDGVVQEGKVLFHLVWIGSVVAILVCTGLGIQALDGTPRMLLFVAAALYLLAVQLPTAVGNLPLNNHLQSLHVANLDSQDRRAARVAFEGPWNRWNHLRTVCASIVSTLLLILCWLT